MSIFSDWLESRFLQWQANEGRRSSMQEFSEYLDVSRVSLSQYMNGKRTPDDVNIAKIAAKLGTEIYGLLGRDVDRMLVFIVNNWDKLSDKQKEQLIQHSQDFLFPKQNI